MKLVEVRNILLLEDGVGRSGLLTGVGLFVYFHCVFSRAIGLSNTDDILCVFLIDFIGFYSLYMFSVTVYRFDVSLVLSGWRWYW
jgi:hypothetical protein